MHIRRISVAKYPYPIRIRSNKEITIRISENCGYLQNIYPRIHIRASLTHSRLLLHVEYLEAYITQ